MTHDDSSCAKLLFGCRHPESFKGKWDRAFVVCQCFEDSAVTCGMFDSGKDYIFRTKNLQYGIDIFYDYLKKGWIEMDDTDITATSGMQITPGTTVRVPPKLRRFRMWVCGMVVTALLFCTVISKRKGPIDAHVV